MIWLILFILFPTLFALAALYSIGIVLVILAVMAVIAIGQWLGITEGMVMLPIGLFTFYALADAIVREVLDAIGYKS